MSLIILPKITSPTIPLVFTFVSTVFKLPTSFANPLISPIALLTPPICSITLSNDCFNFPSNVFSIFSLTVSLILSNFLVLSSLISFNCFSKVLLIFSNSSFVVLLNSLISNVSFSLIFSLESLLSFNNLLKKSLLVLFNVSNLSLRIFFVFSKVFNKL